MESVILSTSIEGDMQQSMKEGYLFYGCKEAKMERGMMRGLADLSKRNTRTVKGAAAGRKTVSLK